MHYLKAASTAFLVSEKKFLDTLQRHINSSNTAAQLKKNVTKLKAENKVLKTKVGAKKAEKDAALVKEI